MSPYVNWLSFVLCMFHAHSSMCMELSPQSLPQHDELEVSEQAPQGVGDAYAKNTIGRACWWYRAQSLDHGEGQLVNAARYLSNGSSIVTLSSAGVATAWDSAEYTQEKLFDVSGTNHKMAMSADGKYVAVSGEKRYLPKQSVVAVLGMAPIKNMRQYDVDVSVGSLLFHPSQSNILLIALNNHNSLRKNLWDRSNDEVLVENVQNAQTVARLKPRQKLHGSDISAIAIHPKGYQYLVAYWYQKLGKEVAKIAVYNDVWQKIGTLAQEGPTSVVEFQSQGKLLATGCSKGKVGLWDADGNKLPTLRHWRCSLENTSHPDRAAGINDIKFHPSNKLLAIASECGYVQLKDFEGNAVVELRQQSAVREIAFHPDGTSLVVVGANDSHEFDNGAVIWKQHEELTLKQVLLRKVFHAYYKECIKSRLTPEIPTSTDNMVPWMADKFDIVQDELADTWNSLPEDLKQSMMNKLIFLKERIARDMQ